MYKENYHTHMRLCHHGEGNIKDYIEQALKLGFTHLGMSDHGPLENAGFIRMNLDEFYNVYLKEFDELKKIYQDKIKLYLGLEIEYFYGRDSYYEKLLENLDYLILGNHYYSGYIHKNETSSYECNTIDRVEEYVKLTVDALNTGYFKIFAHPDIFLAGYPVWDIKIESYIKLIIEACIKNHVYLELNVNGFDKGVKDFKEFKDYSYPNRRFFEIVASYKDAKVIVSSDAHKPIDLDKNLERGYEMLEELGIKPILHPLDSVYD